MTRTVALGLSLNLKRFLDSKSLQDGLTGALASAGVEVLVILCNGVLQVHLATVSCM